MYCSTDEILTLYSTMAEGAAQPDAASAKLLPGQAPHLRAELMADA